ncbi:MAG: aldose epimerase family protein [Bacteroidales bacterium]|jgi:aldose 1-epimerase|nr:aldose epimerase family protein [Bacteroidales bacterium]
MKITDLKMLTPVLALLLFAGCRETINEEYTMKRENFGEIDGKKVELITLTNNRGNTVKLTNYGATLVWLEVPDREGERENITFGYETLEEYVNGDPYFGSVVGRYANRIANAKFTLDGVEYILTVNNPPNTLHGGPGGWHSVVWDTEIIEKEGEKPKVKFTYISPDMEEGYPGEVTAEASYTWTDLNELVIEYKCSTDKKTVLNITNHAYFNLHGAGIGNILDHELTIAASKFTPVDAYLIPTGELRPVEGTPFDFTSPHVIGERIEDDHEQLRLGLVYDHNFVLDNKDEPDAVVYESGSGRMIEMTTDQPGVQFYCGNFLDGLQVGHGGKGYEYRSGLCLETQHFPDSPNQPEFPSTVLEPGKPFTSKTVYKFSVR